LIKQPHSEQLAFGILTSHLLMLAHGFCMQNLKLLLVNSSEHIHVSLFV